MATTACVQRDAGPMHVPTARVFVCTNLQEGDAMRVKRTLKSRGGLVAEPGAKLVFVIRIRGISKMHPKVMLLQCKHLPKPAASMCLPSCVRAHFCCPGGVTCSPRRCCSCCGCGR